MGRAARVLVIVSALALGAPTVPAQAPVPRLTLTGDVQRPALKGPPSTRLDFSFVGKDGKDVSFQAQTDPLGEVPFGYVPWDEFTRRREANRAGPLALPDQGFGVVQHGSAEADTLVREPIATWGGKLVDPSRYVYNVASPFSLFCRAGEGPPQSLSTGDRFVFVVPGPSSALQTVLSQPFISETHWFALPGNAGFTASTAAGKDPQATWVALQALAQRGTIADLERDPCMQCLPDAPSTLVCAPDDRNAPVQVARLPGHLAGVLREPLQTAPIGGATVIVGPMSPTPFFDPGQRPGDEKPPMLVQTGNNGRYDVSLGTMTGGVEITVAKGCDQRTTVAVVGETPATVARTQMTTQRPGYYAPPTVVRGAPQPPTPATTTRNPPVVAPPTSAQPTPQPNERVCGPDITDYVLGVLEFMIETHSQLPPGEVQSRCASLYGLEANGAWDMRLLGPYDSDREKDKYLWFGRMQFADRCAVPRVPCGPSVQFLGACLDAQIVNYVQWGVLNKLCDSVGEGVNMHWLRDLVSNFAGGIAAGVEGGVGQLDVRLGHTDNFGAQDLMSRLGGHFASSSTSIRNRKERLESFMRYGVQRDTAIASLPTWDCPLTCGKYMPDQSFMNGWEWGFKWGDKWFDRMGRDLRKP